MPDTQLYDKVQSVKKQLNTVIRGKESVLELFGERIQAFTTTAGTNLIAVFIHRVNAACLLVPDLTVGDFLNRTIGVEVLRMKIFDRHEVMNSVLLVHFGKQQMQIEFVIAAFLAIFVNRNTEAVHVGSLHDGVFSLETHQLNIGFERAVVVDPCIDMAVEIAADICLGNIVCGSPERMKRTFCVLSVDTS